MSNNYRRPAWYQIEKTYRCRRCGMEQRPPAGTSAIMPCPSCKGFVEKISESYPSDSGDWDEKRVGDINSPWVNERTGKYLGH